MKTFTFKTEKKQEFVHRKFLSVNLKKASLQVSTKGEKEMFGLEESLKGKDRREFSCLCLSDVKVFAISVTEFFSKLESPIDKELLEKKHSLRNKWTENRVDSLQKIEKVKHEKSFTPIVKVYKSVSPEPYPIKIAKPSPPRKLPSIMSRLMPSYSIKPQLRGRVESFSHRGSHCLFETEPRYNFVGGRPERGFKSISYITPIKLQSKFGTHRKISSLIKHY